MTDEPDDEPRLELSDVKAGARAHPYVAFGVLLIPVTYGVTGDPMISLFTGGIVAFGPAIGEGFNELQEDDSSADEDEETGDSDDE